ncbi:MAG TPA: hypothetical protein VFX98_08350 [Longimicrobiaceae bacterium]|nr:hypothetical protein [Longimicrobiaceae bacterium]
MRVRAVRLPDAFYLPRTDELGREVRDVMPWEGAVSYATDGRRLGIEYPDGEVVWLGALPRAAAGGDGDGRAPVKLEEDFEGVNLEALVEGMRSYMDLHPVLKTVWRDDFERLDALRRSSGES